MNDELYDTDALIWLCPLSAWSLVQARLNGQFMKANQYGLYWGNNSFCRPDYKNPVIVWSQKPIEKSPDKDTFFKALDEFYKNFTCHPDEGWSLYEAAKEKGFDPIEESIPLEEWIFDFLAKWMKTHRGYSWREEV